MRLLSLLILFTLTFTVGCSDETKSTVSIADDTTYVVDSIKKDDSTSVKDSSDVKDTTETTDSVDVSDSSAVKDSTDIKDTTMVEDSTNVKTMYVDGRFLYAPDGEKVILRGVNIMSVWNDISGSKMEEIAKTGANVVRIVWTTDSYATAEAFDKVIQACIDNHMIPMVENHSATGAWAELPTVIDWWLQDEIVEVLKKHQEYLLLNIANEAGNSVNKDDFRKVYADAITRFRAKGLNMPIVIDASKYGQNITILQTEGPALIEHDPLSNLLFSVHMWWPLKYYPTVEDKVKDGIEKSVEMELPLIVGEFGEAFSEAGEPTPEDSIPYKLILKECQENEIGWLAWSWGPGNNPQTDLDMTVDGMFNTLHDWGLEVAITDSNSIRNTSVIPKFIGGPIEHSEMP